MNVGASAPEQAGLYFSWGNTQGHTSGEGYDFNVEDYEGTPGASLNENLPLANDAAHIYMGGSWRMPTTEEFQELFNSSYTTHEWVTDYKGSGMNGYLVTSKANGNKLFFPAAGHFDEGFKHYGSGGYYWSSSIDDETLAYSIYFDNENVNSDSESGRFNGLSVRAVQ